MKAHLLAALAGVAAERIAKRFVKYQAEFGQ